MTDRSKLLAEASSASDRLMDFITDKPDWQVPEPKAVISLETATAFAMVYAKERADAEAAAMRERAAGHLEARADVIYPAGERVLMEDQETAFALRNAAAAIRALPATGEVE